MSFPNQSSLQGAVQQLKDIVISLQGEDHESTRLVRQMEALIIEIEKKTGKDQGKGSVPPVKAITAPLTAT